MDCMGIKYLEIGRKNINIQKYSFNAKQHRAVTLLKTNKIKIHQ